MEDVRGGVDCVTSSGRRARVASAGTFHGGVPYGYRATGDRYQSGHGVLVVDERHAEAVRRAFQLHDGTRMTLKEIAAKIVVREGRQDAFAFTKHAHSAATPTTISYV